MLFNRKFFIIVLWTLLFQLKFIRADREDDHVHIKVHVPQVYKKVYHHKTVAKHHFHHPKKLHHPHFNKAHYEPHTIGNVEPQIDFPLLSGPTISKYVKWQEKQNSPSPPITWYSESPTGFTIEKPKIYNNLPLKSESNFDEYKLSNIKTNSFNSESDFDHFSSQKFPQYNNHEQHQFAPHSMTSLKDFRINVENDYKNYPIKTYSGGVDGFSSFDDDHQHHDHDEYAAEEDTDSYMENTETLSMPSSIPYTATQSMMMVSGSDDYYESPSISPDTDDSYSNFNSNWMNSHGNSHANNNFKQRSNKRPYRENGPLKSYGDNSWISHSPEKLFIDWNKSNNNFGKSRPVRGGLSNTKMKGRKPFGFPGNRNPFSNQNEHHSMNFKENTNNDNNFESYIGNEFGPGVLNEYFKRNKRPRRKSRPKWNKNLQNDTEFKF